MNNWLRKQNSAKVNELNFIWTSWFWKGTQAKNLEKKLNNFQISTGEMLRDEIKKDTEIGKKIINNMNEGKFVNDEIVNKLMKKVIFDPQKKR